MPTSETAEKRGNEPPYRRQASFAKLLNWHLDFGTRPTGSPGRPGKRWGNVEFAEAVGTNERSVRNWRSGRVRPSNLGSIEYVLFGRNDAYKDWRFDLRAAYEGHQPADQAGEIPLPPSDFLGRQPDIPPTLNLLLSPTPRTAPLPP